MSKLYFILLFILVVLTNCQKVVDADNLLDVDERVFINAYISPTDTILRVRVSKTLPSIGTPLSSSNEQANRDLFLIKDAFVTISNSDGNVINLNYSENDESYNALPVDFPILEGNSYFLEVTVNGVEYKSSCQIPEKLIDISETINLRTDESGIRSGIINVSFDDFIGSRNFYILGGRAQFTLEDQTTLDAPLSFDTDRFLNDDIEDGIRLSGENNFFFGPADEVSVTLTFQVAHVEEILYQSLLVSDQNNRNEGNPFVENIIAPDNIEGINGIGVFAGYQITEKTIELPQ